MACKPRRNEYTSGSLTTLPGENYANKISMASKAGLQAPTQIFLNISIITTHKTGKTGAIQTHY